MKIRAGVRVLIVFPLYLLPCRERVTVLCRAPRCVFVCVCVCLCVYSRVGASCVGRRMCVCVVSAPLRRVNTSHRWSVGTFPFWPLFPLVNRTATIISPPRALTPRNLAQPRTRYTHMPFAMDIDPPMDQVQNGPTYSRSGQSNDPTPQVDHLIFDTNMYEEGRRCVHVLACETSSSTSSTCTLGDWVEARVLLWADKDRALHVTVVKAVSHDAPTTRAPPTRQTHHRCLSPRVAGGPTARLQCGHSPLCGEG